MSAEKNKMQHLRHRRELPHYFSLAVKVAAMVTGAKRGACHLNTEEKGRRHSGYELTEMQEGLDGKNSTRGNVVVQERPGGLV